MAEIILTPEDYIKELDDQRKELVKNIAAMGVGTSEEEKFNTLVPKVLDIETGVTPTGEIEITDNGEYDVTDYASANVNVPKGLPIEITSLDSSLLVEENEGKVYKYNGKLYRIIKVVENTTPTNLTGTTWVFNTKDGSILGDSTLSRYFGTYNILYSTLNDDDTVSNYTTLYILGAVAQDISTDNFLSVQYGDIYTTRIYGGYGDGGLFSNVKSITFTGETDTTNSLLIEFMEEFATSESTSFIFQEILSPSGELAITENGSYDVTNYKTTNINVPIPDGYIKPEGEVEIVESGTYDVTNYASANVKAGLKINGVIEQYKVNVGANVNVGDFVEFVTKYNTGIFEDSGAVSYVSACKLDNNRVLVAYRDDTTTYGMAVVLSVNEDGVTLGEKVVFNSANTTYISVTTLDENRVIVAYSDGNNSDYGTTVVLSVENLTILVGTPYVFKKTTTKDISIVTLNKNKVMIGYVGSRVETIVLIINENIITEIGTSIQIDSFDSGVLKLLTLSETNVFIWCTYTYGYGHILSVEGTIITKGETVYLGASHYVDAVKLSENKLCLLTSYSTYYGSAEIIDVSGTTITRNTSISFNNSSSKYLSATRLTKNKVLVVYQDGNNSNRGTSQILTINEDDTITVGTENAFDFNTITYTSLISFSETSALVIYNNGKGSYSGLTIDGTTITSDGTTLGTYVQPANTRLHNVGIAKTSGVEGEVIDVYCVRSE